MRLQMVMGMEIEADPLISDLADIEAEVFTDCIRIVAVPVGIDA